MPRRAGYQWEKKCRKRQRNAVNAKPSECTFNIKDKLRWRSMTCKKKHSIAAAKAPLAFLSTEDARERPTTTIRMVYVVAKKI